MRLPAAGPYQAGSWTHQRRVVSKAEALEKGLNTRFVVTTRCDPPDELYTWDTRRGAAPGDLHQGSQGRCFADRLSCPAFWRPVQPRVSRPRSLHSDREAKQFRLLLHSAVYWLLDTIRRWLARLHVPYLQCATLRLRLLKIGGWVRQRRDAVYLHSIG